MTAKKPNGFELKLKLKFQRICNILQKFILHKTKREKAKFVNLRFGWIAGQVRPVNRALVAHYL